MQSKTQGRGSERLCHKGQGTELFTIFIVNLLLKILTLGIYHFWAKTRVRRYLWSQTEVDGERLEYHGRGLELCYGFVLALVMMVSLILATVLVGTALSSIDPKLAPLATILLYLTMVVLMGMGMYGAHRYLMSRTALRGVRFGQSGSPVKYGFMLLGYGVLNLLTLFLFLPVARERMRSYQMNNCWYGDEQFVYDGQARELFGKYLICWLLMIPTLSLSWLWFRAAELRHTAEHTRLRGVQFSSDITGGKLFWLHFSNFLILVFTLGLGFPWVILRSVKLSVTHLQLHGELDYHRITQTQQVRPATGDGLVEVFDMGGI